MPPDDDSDDAPGDLPEDLAAFTPPLPPDDRLWRHPSEMASATSGHPASRPGAPDPTVRGSRPHHGRRGRGLVDLRLWLVAGTSALAGVVLTLLALSLNGTFETTEHPPQAAGEVKIVVPENPGESEIAMTQALAPSVASVSATGPVSTNTGTALVLRSDGHLVTTADAVEGAQQITVTFADGTATPATVVGIDLHDDVAVIKVDRTDLTPFPVGDVDDLQLGARATVLSTAESAPGSSKVAVGLISGLGEQVHLSSDTAMHGLIQTSIRLSSAESGAPLVDSKGEVIGLVTRRGQVNDVEPPATTPDPAATPDTQAAHDTDTDTEEQGVTVRFAVSIDWVQDVASDLIATGQVDQVWLGIRGGELSATQVTTMGYDGALVTEVTEESPAHQAGIEAGDVIVAVDGVDVGSMSDLIVCIRNRDPGDAVSIGLLREGIEQSATVTLAAKAVDAD